MYPLRQAGTHSRPRSSSCHDRGASARPVKPEPAASVDEQKLTPKAAPQPQPAASVNEQRPTPKAAPEPPAASVNEQKPTPEAAPKLPALTVDVSPEAKGAAGAEGASKCDKENMHTHIIALSNPFAQRTCHVTQYSHRPCCTSGAPQRR